MQAALQLLQQVVAFSVEVIDVDNDPQLEARYGEKVPVLVCTEADCELCHYFLDVPAVTAFLEKTR
jgi:hypothetical protein